MRNALMLCALLVAVGLAGCVDDGPNEVDGADTATSQGTLDDVVVVAVIDGGFNPYHFDFLADHMPQHLDEDPGNDLPLDRAPHEWLSGFPDPEEAFQSYAAMELTLTPNDPDADPSCQEAPGTPPVIAPTECPDGPGLYQQDADEWDNVTLSTLDEVDFRYIPGTKVVGFVNFGYLGSDDDGFDAASHGAMTSSNAVGNFHGTCPECVYVFINGHYDSGPLGSGPGRATLEWVNQQDWIDVVSNSYGHSSFFRDNIWDHCDTELQREAVERGQQIVFSAGNGLANAFVAPPYTLASCQKGPDWIITVGAIDGDDGSSPSGHGKPVDISSSGLSYPVAGSSSVHANDTAGGTSFSAPTVSGHFAGALHDVRHILPGSSRVQEAGIIARGEFTCGDANPDCALADGELTVHELREAIFRAAEPTGAYIAPAGFGNVNAGTGETERLTEGHGSFYGHRAEDWRVERQRIVDFVTGERHEELSGLLHDWMVAKSYCSQQVWGEWEHGYWKPGDALPEADRNQPYRSWLVTACPEATEAIIMAGSNAGPFNHL